GCGNAHSAGTGTGGKPATGRGAAGPSARSGPGRQSRPPAPRPDRGGGPAARPGPVPVPPRPPERIPRRPRPAVPLAPAARPGWYPWVNPAREAARVTGRVRGGADRPPTLRFVPDGRPGRPATSPASGAGLRPPAGGPAIDRARRPAAATLRAASPAGSATT